MKKKSTMPKTESIQIWPFEEAPEEFRELSENGRDKDWLMLVPKCFTRDAFPYWLENIGGRQCRDVGVIQLEDGSEVRIGSNGKCSECINYKSINLSYGECLASPSVPSTGRTKVLPDDKFCCFKERNK